ncbi:ROK family protein [Rhodohalobacter sulfatireducens]|uniref:ROK family protein n=1 Tax=Rhodohalobacter sulfatireducens TaxID=2911366 RepID=A0ABS9KEF4_9BACT|nr:ROK family protein [Rhodohalobacter sulfatireducens]MCG2589225.1 ROK family protein [Rhodohalobacter sulfatireducens]MDR9366812.1 ROK family protein [Balneolaceae bacterium]MDR9409820.1 ROK family protein [Balneolaceae bacterium]
MELVAGIDLGGTDTKFGLVSREGKLFAYQSIPTNAEIGHELFFEQLSDSIQDMVEALGPGYKLVGVSVGAPTGSQKNGTIDNASNLNWPRKLPVANILSANFNLPVSVSNDANAAAVGEMLFGVAQNKKDFLCVTLGTGLGCGIVIDGDLVLGSRGHAGELGHVLISGNGRECGCGRKGCLETYASATGIVRTANELIASEEYPKSVLQFSENGSLSAKKITKAANEGDELALRAFEITGRFLGRTLANTVALLNPELIVLTGGLSRSKELILEPTQRNMEENLLDIYKGTVELKLSEISGKRTAILGTAAFMWLKLDSLSKQTA